MSGHHRPFASFLAFALVGAVAAACGGSDADRLFNGGEGGSASDGGAGTTEGGPSGGGPSGGGPSGGAADGGAADGVAGSTDGHAGKGGMAAEGGDGSAGKAGKAGASGNAGAAGQAGASGHAGSAGQAGACGGPWKILGTPLAVGSGALISRPPTNPGGAPVRVTVGPRPRVAWDGARYAIAYLQSTSSGQVSAAEGSVAVSFVTAAGAVSIAPASLDDRAAVGWRTLDLVWAGDRYGVLWSHVVQDSGNALTFATIGPEGVRLTSPVVVDDNGFPGYVGLVPAGNSWLATWSAIPAPGIDNGPPFVALFDDQGTVAAHNQISSSLGQAALSTPVRIGSTFGVLLADDDDFSDTFGALTFAAVDAKASPVTLSTVATSTPPIDSFGPDSLSLFATDSGSIGMWMTPPVSNQGTLADVHISAQGTASAAATLATLPLADPRSGPAVAREKGPFGVVSRTSVDAGSGLAKGLVFTRYGDNGVAIGSPLTLPVPASGATVANLDIVWTGREYGVVWFDSTGKVWLVRVGDCAE